MLEPKDVGRVRRRLNLTQQELAKLSGVSQSLIAKIESGKVDPSYSKLKALSDTLMKLQKRELKKAKDVMSKEIIGVEAEQTVADAAGLMRKYAISKLPVYKGGKVVGSISEKGIVALLSESRDPKKVFSAKVENAMEEPFPTVSEETPVELLYSLLSFFPAVLVQRRSDVVGIVTKADLIKAD